MSDKLSDAEFLKLAQAKPWREQNETEIQLATRLESALAREKALVEALIGFTYSDDHDCMGPPHAERHCEYCKTNREVKEILESNKAAGGTV